ncbi:sigma-70 family RNA polymerase sigma factor [Clostridioides sp. ZZV13-5731]|uniref:hypothetical protein n=1 Tax=Clostridioides sp. ZZV13-5731 TaxID=2811485 RepID=UPI001D0FE2E4|nr:sigma-70 family RNA polymerase sigma factor [Clostridioides sp. ZZV13-5731]
MAKKRKNCSWCGKGFSVDVESRDIFCSLECAEKFENGKDMYIYSESKNNNNIEKTKKMLSDLSWKFRRKKILQEENEILKVKDFAGNINFNELGIKGKSGYKTLDDLIIEDEQKIFLNECEIISIDRKIKSIEIFLDKLEKSEYDVLMLKYFTDGKKEMILRDIAEKSNFSLPTVKRKYDSAIEKIAIYKFGE